VLVRVPEAYPLLGPFEATRPGLLVLDADGRRVDARALAEGDDPAAVAAWLKAALTAQARERWVLRGKRRTEAGGSAAAVAEALGKVAGVHGVEAKEDLFFVLAKPGALTPAGLAALGEKVRVDLEIVEPVPVALVPGKDADPLVAARALANVAGVWAVAEEPKGLRAYVTRHLLDPAAPAKAAPGWTMDVEARRYAIPKAPLGPPGMKIATSVGALPGVLAVFPALAEETVTVIGRKAPAPWPEVLKALQGVVPGAAEKP
jgi:hypothetical protein